MRSCVVINANFVSFILQEDKQHSKFIQGLTAAAEKKAGDIFFISVNPSENSHALEFFGLKEADSPAFVLQDGSDKFIRRNTNPKDLDSFISSFEVRSSILLSTYPRIGFLA